MKKGIAWLLCMMIIVSLLACGGSGGGGNTTGNTTGNTAAVANAGSDQNLATGTLVTLNGGGSTDANGDALTYSWSFTSKPASSTATLSSATVVKPTFTADKDGAYVLSLVVNDGTVSSAADTVTITAAPGNGGGGGNTAPVSNAGPDQYLATGTLVTLNGGGSTDANGDALTYSWSFTSKPASSTATLSSATVVNPTFTADKVGAYVLSLVVNDGTVSSTADTVTITAAIFKISDTNQTTSYTTTFGEDSDYTINPSSYTDNGDGTITDNVTALVWQKNNSTWLSWDDAHMYCPTLKLGGGITQWRLPSRIELVSLLDFSKDNSYAIDNTYFGTPTNYFFWSSTFYESTGSNWVVDFKYDGFVGNQINDPYPSSNFVGYARCVRGGQSAPQSLTDNGDGTVTDNWTHLMWQQGETSAMQWEAALMYCEGLSLGGNTDWRLPNCKELLSIVDDTSYNNPSINTIMFPNAITEMYWSSTLSYNYENPAKTVDFYDGHYHPGSSGDNKLESNYVRCVRGGQ